MKNYEREDFETKKPKHSKAIRALSIAFMFVFGIGAIAVAFALASTNISGGGNVSFDANGVIAQVRGSISGTKNEHQFNNIDITEDTEQGNIAETTWQNVDFSFTSDNLITFTITIENNNINDNPVFVRFTDTKTFSNVTFKYKVDNDNETTTVPAVFSIGKAETSVITIKMNVTNPNKSVTGSYSFNLQLSNSAIS